jgi:hypothetical protein
MRAPWQRLSFSTIMRLWLVLLFYGVTQSFAQRLSVEGIVFDKGSRERIAKVHIHNKASGETVFNNLKGEFTIAANSGDVLIFSKEGFYNDTLQVKGKASVAVYLKSTGIQLSEVKIRDTLMSPEKKYAATKRDYTVIYGPAANPDFLTTSPYGGAGIGIDALFNALSKKGRNAAHLKEIIERDYKQDVIDYRFNRQFVANVTGLKDEQLTDFMERYRPGYYMVTTASDYEFIRYIRSSLKRYLRNPNNFGLPPLNSKE